MSKSSPCGDSDTVFCILRRQEHKVLGRAPTHRPPHARFVCDGVVHCASIFASKELSILSSHGVVCVPNTNCMSSMSYLFNHGLVVCLFTSPKFCDVCEVVIYGSISHEEMGDTPYVQMSNRTAVEVEVFCEYLFCFIFMCKCNSKKFPP